MNVKSNSKLVYFSESRSKIQLVLGEHDMYNDREQFSEEFVKIQKIIVHPKVFIKLGP